MSIRFFKADISFRISGKTYIQDWLLKVARRENYRIDELNIILCSDNYLLDMNRQYLDHDTFTDIITFDNSTADGMISGELYISIDRVKENAVSFGTTASNELQRVIVHGLLHLCGYKDKTARDKKEMTRLEDFYLSLRNFV